jgi:teichoic acid transport system permease protein
MSLTEMADRHGLHRVGARPSLLAYLKQTWERRDFISTMAAYRMAETNQENRLGALWLVLRPTLNAVIYGLIFGVLQSAVSRGQDYAAHVVIGVFLFDFFSACFQQGARAITGNRALVQSLSFPRISLPLAVVVEQFYTLLLSLIVMFGILIVLGHLPDWRWLLMVPLVGLYTLFNAGVAMFTARLTVHFRDLTQILPFVSRILFYTSGALFDVNKIFSAHPWVIQVYDWHPLYQVLTIARSLLMTHAAYDPMYWLYLSGWSVVALVGGFCFFWVAEEHYGRD